MRLVEFIGIPGSGKSDLYRAVVRASRESGGELLDYSDALLQHGDLSKMRWPVSSILRACNERQRYRLTKWESSLSWRLFGGKRRYFRDNAALLATVDRYLRLAEMSEEHRIKLFSSFMYIARRYQFASAQLPNLSPFVLDEGFAHRVVNLFVVPKTDPVDADGIQEYLKHIPRVDVLIRVVASGHTAALRMRDRGHPARLDDADDSMIATFLDNAVHVTSIAAKKLESRGTMLLHVDNDEWLSPDGLNSLGRRIYADVLEYLARA